MTHFGKFNVFYRYNSRKKTYKLVMVCDMLWYVWISECFIVCFHLHPFNKYNTEISKIPSHGWCWPHSCCRCGQWGRRTRRAPSSNLSWSTWGQGRNSTWSQGCGGCLCGASCEWYLPIHTHTHRRIKKQKHEWQNRDNCSLTINLTFTFTHQEKHKKEPKKRQVIRSIDRAHQLCHAGNSRQTVEPLECFHRNPFL